MTQEKFSMRSVAEDEELERAMIALGFSKPKAASENELDSSIERRARQAAKHNGGLSNAEANHRMSKFNAKQRQAQRQRQLCLEWYDYHASLQETHERIAAEHEQKAQAYLTEGTTT